jgi:hypothetical protein
MWKRRRINSGGGGGGRREKKKAEEKVRMRKLGFCQRESTFQSRNIRSRNHLNKILKIIRRASKPKL